MTAPTSTTPISNAKRRTGLAILSALSNEDKHRLPVARVVAVAPHEEGTTGLVAVNDCKLSNGKVLTGRPLDDRDEIGWADLIVTGPDPQVEMTGQLPFDVAFGDIQVTAQGLAELFQHTGLVVSLMARVGWPHDDDPLGLG